MEHLFAMSFAQTRSATRAIGGSSHKFFKGTNIQGQVLAVVTNKPAQNGVPVHEILVLTEEPKEGKLMSAAVIKTW
jgi:hypothetical protein